MSSSSAIPKTAFQVVIATTLGLAIISAIARFIIRFVTRRPLYWDDLALSIGIASLISATALVLKNTNNFFLSNELQQNPGLAFSQPPAVLNDLVTNSLVYLYAFLALAWTTTFAVKISFLIFFKQLIQRLGKINLYFWVVTWLTVLSWMFLISEPFILCPDFGYKSLQCYGPTRDHLYVSMTSLVTTLDVLTDIMIASIPIMVLRKSQIPLKQKIILACFLCLSLVMAALAIVRVSKIHGSTNVDVVWEIFWQYMEAGTAVLMASITTFRTILNMSQAKREKKWEPSKSWIQRMRLRRSSENSGEQSGLPSIPAGTLSGLRTFIRRNNRTTGATTMMKSEMASTQNSGTCADSLDEEVYWKKEDSSYRRPQDRSAALPRATMNSRQTDSTLAPSMHTNTNASRSYGSYGGNTVATTEHGSINDPPRSIPSFV